MKNISRQHFPPISGVSTTFFFSDILQIDNLWILSGLRKLQLSNNFIEKIVNLEGLTNLRELDLSFNNISQLENLDSLVNLEVLTVFENKISKLENMENLKRLKVFSAGNNKLSHKDNVRIKLFPPFILNLSFSTEKITVEELQCFIFNFKI